MNYFMLFYKAEIIHKKFFNIKDAMKNIKKIQWVRKMAQLIL